MIGVAIDMYKYEGKSISDLIKNKKTVISSSDVEEPQFYGTIVVDNSLIVCVPGSSYNVRFHDPLDRVIKKVHSLDKPPLKHQEMLLSGFSLAAAGNKYVVLTGGLY